MQPAILLVADQSAARAVLEEAFSEERYVVTEVADGAQALDLLRLNLTRKRPHRLVVLHMASCETDVTDFLRALPDDARVAVHHAYVYVLPAESHVAGADAQAVPGLSISALRQPCPAETVRAVVARAARQLGMGADGAGRRD